MQRDQRKSYKDFLPLDADRALLLGRVWSAREEGPVPVLVQGDALMDVSAIAATVSQILELENVVERLRNHRGPIIAQLEDVMNAPSWDAEDQEVKLLAPVDLQCIKACGVTFAVSAKERIIEEQAKGDPIAATRIRAELEIAFGDALSRVKPGTKEAEDIKARLIEQGLWSQYLEVAIGPDAEVFTKAPTLSAVGWGDLVGIRQDSSWTNPEPEVVLICNSRAKIVGVTLGNDVNLRDFEGRSALLLGKGKDNNASASMGPFIRLLDDSFTMDRVRTAEVSLAISGADGFSLRSTNSMTLISRAPEDLVTQTCGADHQYPDGFTLYLGSLFAPVQVRGHEGKNFTHHLGDIVEIYSPDFGCLLNKVAYTSEAPPWTFGLAELMRNLAKRGLL
ncbi:fumarylacetoacetate hydrolase family protein [Govanella unica]|uniref:Fumarylacetoacetate hydrolase family protein n=1 Tax=Govanella unica TaxID=2975056 RepID=A0A9X3Z7A4_9PROT|nr:fumarylacetoacetate hydrolase family protein [Govania unica]MDA5193863.1 fumarylacetoacetate hydrolase family protein [Govania unica]